MTTVSKPSRTPSRSPVSDDRVTTVNSRKSWERIYSLRTFDHWSCYYYPGFKLLNIGEEGQNVRDALWIIKEVQFFFFVIRRNNCSGGFPEKSIELRAS